MKKFSKNLKHTCIYSDKTIYLIKNENYFLINFEDNILHVELDAQMINTIFILSENFFCLANMKKQKFNIHRKYHIEKIEKFSISYFKFLYLKNNNHFVFIVNNLLYFINEYHELKNFKFDSQILESYATFDKSNGESIVILDDEYNFYIYDPMRHKLKQKIKFFENQSKIDQITNFNFLPTSEGYLLFWLRKNYTESVLIKSIENLKNLKLNKGNNNYLNNLNFDIGQKNLKTVLSYYSKDVSILTFTSYNGNKLSSLLNKLNLLIFWNKSKRFNLCELETDREIFDVNISVFKVRINILID